MQEKYGKIHLFSFLFRIFATKEKMKPLKAFETKQENYGYEEENFIRCSPCAAYTDRLL